MPIDAVVLDFETANPSHASVCAIGATRITGGQLGVSWHQLVRPTPPYDAFWRRNIEVHGITPAMIADKPSFASQAPGVMRAIGRGAGIVVAHGATSSDLSMLDQSLTAAGLRMPTVPYVCSLALAKQVVPGALSYRLPDLVAVVLGEQMVGHHDAGVDAHCTARLVLAMLRIAGLSDLTDLVRHRRPRAGPLPAPKEPQHGVSHPVPSLTAQGWA